MLTISGISDAMMPHRYNLRSQSKKEQLFPKDCPFILCDYLIKNQDDQDQHYLTNHHVCLTCCVDGKIKQSFFNDSKSLLRHCLEVCHNDKILYCQQCFYEKKKKLFVTIYEQDLHDHLWKVHNGQDEKNVRSDKKPGAKYPCSIKKCQRHQQPYYHLHDKLAHEARTHYICPVCDDGIQHSTLEDLIVHAKEQEHERFYCSICEKIIIIGRDKELERHEGKCRGYFFNDVLLKELLPDTAALLFEDIRSILQSLTSQDSVLFGFE